jgi:hypothetical protein
MQTLAIQLKNLCYLTPGKSFLLLASPLLKLIFFPNGNISPKTEIKKNKNLEDLNY